MRTLIIAIVDQNFDAIRSLAIRDIMMLVSGRCC